MLCPPLTTVSFSLPAISLNTISPNHPAVSLQSPPPLPAASPSIPAVFYPLSTVSPQVSTSPCPVCTIHSPQDCASPLPYPLSPFLLLPPGCASLSHILHSATCSILPSFKPQPPWPQKLSYGKKVDKILKPLGKYLSPFAIQGFLCVLQSSIVSADMLLIVQSNKLKDLSVKMGTIDTKNQTLNS